MTYTITPREQHRDVLLERDGEPLVIVRYREGASDPAGEALAEARRIARAEAVIAAAQPWDTRERCSPGCDCAPCRLGDALAAMRGGSDG